MADQKKLEKSSHEKDFACLYNTVFFIKELEISIIQINTPKNNQSLFLGFKYYNNNYYCMNIFCIYNIFI